MSNREELSSGFFRDVPWIQQCSISSLEDEIECILSKFVDVVKLGRVADTLEGSIWTQNDPDNLKKNGPKQIQQRQVQSTALQVEQSNSQF